MTRLLQADRFAIKTDAILPTMIKFLITLMLVYEGWYIQKYGAIPGALQILASLIIGTTILLILMNAASRKRSKTIGYWLLFGVYSVVAAMAVNANMSIVFSSLLTYFAFIAVIYCAGVVSKCTANYRWFSMAILMVCILCATSALFEGVPYKNGAYFVTTMSELNNPNNLGLTMGIGTFYAVYAKSKNARLLNRIVRVSLVSLFFVVTLNTGSRSALLCELAILMMFVYAKLKGMGGKSGNKLIKKSLLIIGVLTVALIVANIVMGNNTGNSAIGRLLAEFNPDAFSGRTDLYQIAWKMFLTSPLLGIGYNCFASASGYGYFSHSTYMELLACSGLIGFVLFLFPLLNGIIQGVKNFKRDTGRKTTILSMLLVSGLFGILYYNMVFLMVLYMEINYIYRSEGVVK